MNPMQMLSQIMKSPNKMELFNSFAINNPAMQMFKQVMNAPNKMEMLNNFANNDPRAAQILNQIKNLSPEQQKAKLNEMCNQFGISQEQLKNLFK